MKSVEQFTKKEIEMMEFREKLFLEQVEQYRAAVTGEQESILPFVQDEKGNYSEEKTWEFVDELTKCAKIYFQYLNQKWEDSDKFNEIWFSEIQLNEKSENLLKDFFYCAVRVSQVNAWRNHQGSTQTLKDLIIFSEQVYRDECELYQDEVHADVLRAGDYRFTKGIYGKADFLVHLLSGNFVTQYYTKEKVRRYYPYLSEILKKELGSEEEIPHEIAKAAYEAEEQAITIMMEENGEKEDCENPVTKEQEKIKKEFVEKEQFIKRYFRFREELFLWLDEETEADYTDMFGLNDELERQQVVLDLPKTIRGALRLFAEVKGLSCLQNDDAFFTAGAFLRQQSKEIKRLKNR